MNHTIFPRLCQDISYSLALKCGLRPWESIYFSLSGKIIPPLMHSVNQFRHYESTGKQPDNPTIGFQDLLSGKRSFFILKKTLQDDYSTSDWPGMHYLEMTVPEFLLKKLLDWRN